MSQLAGKCIPLPISGLVAAGVAPAGGEGGWQRGAPVSPGVQSHAGIWLCPRAGCLMGLAASSSGVGTSRAGVPMETSACDLK